MKRNHRLVLFVFLVASTLLIIGCSKPTGDLSGKISYKGKAVVTGTVTVFDSDQKAYQGGIDQGQYTVKNVPEGAVQIIVVSENPNTEGLGGPKMPDRGTKSGPKSAREDPGMSKDAPPSVPIAGWFAIPAKYSDAKSSPLKTTMKAGPNPFDIELKD